MTQQYRHNFILFFISMLAQEKMRGQSVYENITVHVKMYQIQQYGK